VQVAVSGTRDDECGAEDYDVALFSRLLSLHCCVSQARLRNYAPTLVYVDAANKIKV
jgi:hypothetical protein